MHDDAELLWAGDLLLIGSSPVDPGRQHETASRLLEITDAVAEAGLRKRRLALGPISWRLQVQDSVGLRTLRRLVCLVLGKRPRRLHRVDMQLALKFIDLFKLVFELAHLPLHRVQLTGGYDRAVSHA